jgi:3-oxoacid CoA-transferase
MDCLLPLTGKECVDMCITEKAVFTWDKQTRQMMLTEIAKGMTLEDVQ